MTKLMLGLMTKPDIINFLSQQGLTQHGTGARQMAVADLRQYVFRTVRIENYPAIKARYEQLAALKGKIEAPLAPPPPSTAHAKYAR